MGDPTPTEMGLTPKDMGLTQTTPEALANAHSKIIRFNTPEYYQGYNEIKDHVPVSTFSFTNGEQTIELIGVQHTNQLATVDEKNKVIDGVKSKLDSYFKNTTTDPTKRLLMIEGGSISGATTIKEKTEQMTDTVKRLFAENNITTEEEAINKFGEPGILMFASIKDGIPIMSPEPSSEEIIEKQKAEGVSEIDIALKQAIIHLDVLSHRGSLKDKKAYTEDELYSALEKSCEESGWQKELLEKTKTDGSKKDFIDTLIPLLNNQMQVNHVGFDLVNPDYTWAFDPANKEIYNHLHSPSSKVDVFRKMSNIGGEFRDHYILDQIVNSVSEGKSPFVLYGDGHVVKLKPAMNTLYNPKSA